MDLVATICPGNVHTVLNLQAGEGGGGAGGGGARTPPAAMGAAASGGGDDARRPCGVCAFDPRSAAAAAAWRQRCIFVRTRIEEGDNQIRIEMGDKQNNEAKPENRNQG